MFNYQTIYFLLLIGLNLSVFGQADYPAQRKTMVETQLKARDIYQPATLRAMGEVPREQFVPKDYRLYAYNDGPLPIGEGQTISQPYIVAYMTQVLQLRAHHKVLEVGTGSGYQAAILAEIVDSVYTIEIVKELGLRSKSVLESLGYHNIELKIGDGYHGWKEKGPFDAIMVTAGAEAIPEPLIDQLSDGGRMIIPVGPHGGVRQLIRITKKDGEIKKKALMAVRFVPFTRNGDPP